MDRYEHFPIGENVTIEGIVQVLHTEALAKSALYSNKSGQNFWDVSMTELQTLQSIYPDNRIESYFNLLIELDYFVHSLCNLNSGEEIFPNTPTVHQDKEIFDIFHPKFQHILLTHSNAVRINPGIKLSLQQKLERTQILQVEKLSIGRNILKRHVTNFHELLADPIWSPIISSTLISSLELVCASMVHMFKDIQLIELYTHIKTDT